MDKSYQQLFRSATITTPADLEQKIIKQLRLAEKRQSDRLLVTNSLIGLISLSGLILIISELISDFSSLSIEAYLNLFIYDQSIIFSYWREFLFWFLESAPILTLTLAVVLITLLTTTILNSISYYRFKRLIIN